MHIVITDVTGQKHTSDKLSKEEILKSLPEEADYDEIIAKIRYWGESLSDLDNFSMFIDGVKTYFNTNHIVTMQVFD